MQGKLALPGVNLHVIDHWLQEEGHGVYEVGDVLPCIFCIIKSDLTLEYLNPVGFEWLSIQSKSFLYINESWLTKYNQHAALKDFLDQLKPQLTKTNPKDVYHDVQRVWFPSEGEYKLCLISAKKSIALGDMIVMMQPLSDIHYLRQRIGRLADEEAFYLSNYSKFKQLTGREIEIISLLYKGMNNPQISRKLSISRKTVEQHRKNINRKLDTSSFVELIKYAQVFDLQD
ncbi:hypothetical protein JMN32_04440 [Fulvivirga sp. 29W222]|uniref:HTH luxR-type domain-containing protein n=1 Tax=Fulvivirga marina TaxID=2494733 RepID=A0A937FV38_9BACT|nr:LuxR family transcriptional regulator [Fulvivirga marina]MBL6445543.1 hypothetical protein [Fulvivirga marina]